MSATLGSTTKQDLNESKEDDKNESKPMKFWRESVGCSKMFEGLAKGPRRVERDVREK